MRQILRHSDWRHGHHRRQLISGTRWCGAVLTPILRQGSEFTSGRNGDSEAAQALHVEYTISRFIPFLPVRSLVLVPKGLFRHT